MRTADRAEHGRRAFAERRWRDAYDNLTAADESSELDAFDLETLGTAAYLIGDDDASGELLTRAHRAFLAGARPDRAARCAFWLGLRLLDGGDHARGGGWLARAHRDIGDGDCVEQGYLLVPEGLRLVAEGNPSGAFERFELAGRIARRFGDDPDLATLAVLGMGQATILLGDPERGLTLLDEAMVAVATEEVSPVPAGIVYCAVISACQLVSDLRRAAEWTGALTRWCEGQPDLVPYRGQCLVHRAQILQWQGDWVDALAEAERACERLAGRSSVGQAYYQRAEIHRLRGDLARAESLYLRAARSGHPVQPGHALLRLAQGQIEDAAAALRRTLDENPDAAGRTPLLAAYVDAMLAADDVLAARSAVAELSAGGHESALTVTVTSHADGLVLLAENEPLPALERLRSATSGWQQLNVPYEIARARVGIARACRAVGDEDSARVELDAARWAFERLGARPDAAAVTALLPPAATRSDGLTARELEILRLVATGSSNRSIATHLVLSERTVARHLSNIFTKLDVGSRSAATAYAYEHDLV